MAVLEAGGPEAADLTVALANAHPEVRKDAARQLSQAGEYAQAKSVLDTVITEETTDPDLIILHANTLNALHEDPENVTTYNDVILGINELIRAHEATDDPVAKSRLSFIMAESYGRIGEYATAQRSYLGAIDSAREGGQENPDAAFMEDGDTDGVLREFHKQAMTAEKDGKRHEARLAREKAVVYALPIPDELQLPAEPEAGAPEPMPEAPGPKPA